MYYFFAITLVILGALSLLSPLYAQTEVSNEVRLADPNMQLPHSVQSELVRVLQSVTEGVHAEKNVQDLFRNVSADAFCHIKRLPNSNESCTVGLKTEPSSEFVYIEYDRGEVFVFDDGTGALLDLSDRQLASTQFSPKTPSDDREVWIDRIWLAPYFGNQFQQSNLSPSAPRDLTVYIFSDDGGKPGIVLFSKTIDDPRPYAEARPDLDFFELDLSHEGLRGLPDVIHIGLGNAGNDDNIIAMGMASYTEGNRSHIFNGEWRELWTEVIINGANVFNEMVVPIRARFRLVNADGSVQFVQRVKDQHFLEGMSINPLILPEALGSKLPISYSLMPELPTGLNFSPSNRTISGTPMEVTAMPVAYTYTATDASGDTASLQFMIEVYPPSGQIVDIQYDDGGIFSTDEGIDLFGIIPAQSLLSTKFEPKRSSDDDRDVRIESIMVAPFFDNQFQDSNLPPSAPRDLIVYIYSDRRGRPGDVLFSKTIDDPRNFAIVNTSELDFFELNLSNEGIGVLPDVIHIAYGNAGNDENLLLMGVSPYSTEDVSNVYFISGSWRSLWTEIRIDNVLVFRETVIPIRARFRLGGDFPLQASQDATIPEAFVVHGNYPNPFRGSTYLQFDLPSAARVTVDVIDLLGRQVLTVPPIDLSSGWGKLIEIDGHSLPSGHYFYRMIMNSEKGNSIQTGQFVRIR